MQELKPQRMVSQLLLFVEESAACVAYVKVLAAAVRVHSAFALSPSWKEPSPRLRSQTSFLAHISNPIHVALSWRSTIRSLLMAMG